MGVSSIGSYGFASYTTPVNGGPTVAQPRQQADQAQQTRQVEETQDASRQQALEAQAAEQQGGGFTTPTRGQNLNITV